MTAATDGVVASRMTGAGFGGCAINLVDADMPDGEVAGLVARYEARTGLRAQTWRSAASPGARELREATAG